MIFEPNSMDVGVVNTIPANQPYIGTTTTPASTQTTPTGVVSAAANQASGLVGGIRVCADLMAFPIEYAVIVPPTKIDGTTATTGTITLSVQWMDKTGANVGSAVSYGAYNLAAGGEVAIFLFPPQFADRFQVTHTLSGGAGAYGSYTAGITLGAKRYSRAF